MTIGLPCIKSRQTVTEQGITFQDNYNVKFVNDQSSLEFSKNYFTKC